MQTLILLSLIFIRVIFSELGIIISLMVIAALSYVIIAITKESVTIINDNREIDFENYEKIEDERW